MSVSQDTLIWRVKALLGNVNNVQGTITGSVTSGDTTIPVNDGTMWSAGDVLEWQDGDLAYVTGVAGNSLSVTRAHLGTTASAHANGAVVYKNPDFYIRDIKDGLDLTIKSLWPYVWKLAAATVTPNANQYWYEVPATIIDLVSVFQVYGDTAKLGVYGSSGNQKPVMLSYNVPNEISTTGNAIAFPNGFVSDDAVKVNYRAKLTAATDTGAYTEIEDGTHAECVAYGAAARLVQAHEGSKVLFEDVAQGEANVEAGDRTRLWAVLQQKHIEYRNNWNDELQRTNKQGMGVYR